MTLTGGTAVAQIISLASAPLLTRLYAPPEMGVLAAMVAIVSVLGALSTGQYEQAILLPKEDKEAFGVAWVGGLLVAVWTLLLGVWLVVRGDVLAARIGLHPDEQYWVLLLLLLVSLLGVMHIAVRLCLRMQQFVPLASSQVMQQMSASVSKIGLGFVGWGAPGLLIGTVLGYAVRVGRLLYAVWPRGMARGEGPSLKTLWSLAVRYRNFPLLASGASAIHVLATHIPIIMFTGFFAPRVVGQFALAYTMMRMPITLVGLNVAHVFQEEAARLRDNEDALGRAARDVFLLMLGLGAVVLPVVTLYGESLFPFVFGAQWVEAGRYAQWIALWLIFVFGAAPLHSVYLVLERQAEGLLWNAVILLMVICSVIVGHVWELPALNVVAIISVTGAAASWTFSLRMLHVAGSKCLAAVWGTVMVCGGCALVHLFVYWLVNMWGRLV